ncbi:hypothetical protein B7435_07095 [Mycolicibacterium peregrinum]|uniref:hypothetical protein n=1 Tax=Mycolicibacterium peregrinum TaxID=43304 RepID=UPI000B4A7D94|nr:hypothetical protein [Mycolicibacterium peregrinum]OWM07843.1 hypothetical protein B7435_07095 [Mycolicibacterium peregrinum]
MAKQAHVFVLDDCVIGPDGEVIVEKSPQTVTDIVKLTQWLTKRGAQAPVFWLLGAELAQRYGWLESPEDVKATAEAVHDSVLDAYKVLDSNAIVEKRAYRFRVCRSWARRDEVIAEVIAARLGMITDGNRGVIDNLVTDDPVREIIHRVRWINDHLGIEAAGPAAQLGARIAEQTWNPLPPEGQWPLTEAQLTPTRLEPVTNWAVEKPARGGKLVVTDQRRAVLAAMGTTPLGVGAPEHFPNAEDIDWADKNPPVAVALVTFPALSYLNLPESFKVHPAQRVDEPVTDWACTRTIKQMLEPTADGGHGMDSSDLEIGETNVWPQTSVKLGAWAKKIRDAIAEADGDPSLDRLFKEIYARYYSHVSSQYSAKTVHSQLVWSGCIRADVRARGLRYQAKIQRDHNGLLPVAGVADAWIYRLPPRADSSFLTDPSTANGKYRVKEELPHTVETWRKLTRTTRAGQPK